MLCCEVSNGNASFPFRFQHLAKCDEFLPRRRRRMWPAHAYIFARSRWNRRDEASSSKDGLKFWWHSIPANWSERLHRGGPHLAASHVHRGSIWQLLAAAHHPLGLRRQFPEGFAPLLLWPSASSSTQPRQRLLGEVHSLGEGVDTSAFRKPLIFDQGVFPPKHVYRRSSGRHAAPPGSGSQTATSVSLRINILTEKLRVALFASTKNNP